MIKNLMILALTVTVHQAFAMLDTDAAQTEPTYGLLDLGNSARVAPTDESHDEALACKLQQHEDAAIPHEELSVIAEPHFDLRTIKQAIMSAFIPGYFPPISTTRTLCRDAEEMASECGNSVRHLSAFKTECTYAAMIKSAISGLGAWTALSYALPKAPSTHLLGISALAGAASLALNLIKARPVFRNFKKYYYNSIARTMSQQSNKSRNPTIWRDSYFALAKHAQGEKEVKRLAKIRNLVDGFDHEDDGIAKALDNVSASIETIDHE